jgi:hypothetical protein
MGATIGAIVGGYAGEPLVESVESVDTVAELAYWRQHFKERPYAGDGSHFEQYEPAYLHAVDAFAKNPGHAFDDIEPHLSRGWRAARGTSTLEWERARPAARDAWARLSDTGHGD